MSAPTEQRLPSGLTGAIGRWSMDDLKAFTDRGLLRRPGPAIETQLMRSAWKETVDHGPYSFDGTPPWSEAILTGDLIVAQRCARIATWGEVSFPEFECESLLCRESIEVEVNLADFPIQDLSDEGRAAFLGGNKIDFTLPRCGRKITYGLSTGASQTRADRLSRVHGRRLEVIWASRTSVIEGVKSPSKFVDFYGQMEPLDGAALQEELDRLDCGLITDVDMVCEVPDCAREQSQDYPFGADFFMSSLAKKTKRRRT
jgi:hypothetical protein